MPVRRGPGASAAAVKSRITWCYAESYLNLAPEASRKGSTGG